MEKYWTYIDAGFKIVLALVAAWSAYLFGYRKQQNDDITLVTGMLADPNPQKQIVGIGLAEAFVKEGRIPDTVFSVVLTTVRDSSASSSAKVDGGKSGAHAVQDAANIALNKAADGNAVVRTQLDQANAALPIRIYFHTVNESDKKEADALGDKIERMNFESSVGRTISIPPTEVIAKYNGKTELRCFKISECQQVAPKIIGILKASGVNSISAVPVDLSKKYEESKNIRPLHFEVWFSAGSVQK